MLFLVMMWLFAMPPPFDLTALCPLTAWNFNWKALESWNFEWRNDKTAKLKIHPRRSKYPYFMYMDKDNPALLPEKNSHVSRDELIFDDELRSFLTSCLHSNQQEGDASTQYIYYTDSLEEDGPLNALLEDVQPFEFLAAPDVQDSKGLFPFTSIWLGSKGSSTQAHFDSPHNFFVQVNGTKEFTFFMPPQEDDHHVGMADLYFYPYLHPRARKSQVLGIGSFKAWDDEDGGGIPTLFPRARNVDRRRLTVKLEAGDVLYVPPFLPHHVVAASASIGINVFSQSKENILMEDIEHMPLPFEGDWEPALFQAATQLWIVQILDALGIDPQVSFPAF
jgi:hypothetical protein